MACVIVGGIVRVYLCGLELRLNVGSLDSTVSRVQVVAEVDQSLARGQSALGSGGRSRRTGSQPTRTKEQRRRCQQFHKTPPDSRTRPIAARTVPLGPYVLFTVGCGPGNLQLPQSTHVLDHYGAMAQPAPVELRFEGPTFDHAVRLARKAAVSVIYGGPASEGSLEFVLTASANDRVLGATVLFLTSAMSGSLARHVVALEAEGANASDEDLTGAAEQLVDEFLLEFVSNPALTMGAVSAPRPADTEGTKR